jgi:hypothetical protein
MARADGTEGSGSRAPSVPQGRFLPAGSRGQLWYENWYEPGNVTVILVPVIRWKSLVLLENFW